MSPRKLLPPVPQTHGHSSKTFTFPPIDGSLLLPEIFDFQAVHSADHSVFIYPNDESNSDSGVTHVTYKHVHRGIQRVAPLLSRFQDLPPPSTTSTIAILAQLDTMSYWTLIHGIIRAGHIPFPLSTRNSAAAVAHLLLKTQTRRIFVSTDALMTKVVTDAQELLLQDPAQKDYYLNIQEPPQFDELYFPFEKDADVKYPPPVSREIDEVAMFLHSSGSTSHPKAIPLTHSIMLQWMRVNCYGERDMADIIFGNASLPMFHALGVINSTSGLGTGTPIAQFTPVLRPLPITPERVIENAVRCGSTMIFALPSILEGWAQNPEYVKILKKMDLVMFCGGPLSKVIGDNLAAEGINVFQAYGITECGVLNVYLPKEIIPVDWEYWQFSKQSHYVLAPQPDSDALEVQFVPCDSHTPAVHNIIIDGKPAYATSDLVLEHPNRPGFYKIVGRVDDQIMLSIGEKTNPGPLEAIMNKDPLIKGAVMFGRGRPQNGVIIEPEPSAGVVYSDADSVNAYIDKIWPTVEVANAYAPQHSRLFRELILIANPAKPFTVTGKGSIRKSFAVKEHEPEIEALYAAFEARASANVEPPKNWEKDQVLDYVRRVIDKVLVQKVKDEDDIFQYGGDSLQATFIRNSVVNDLKAAKFDTSSIGANYVYEYPTIVELAEAISDVVSPSSASSTSKVSRKVAEMERLVEKYSSSFPTHTPALAASSSTEQIIFLTGTTGALGATMLAQLVADSNVKKIYAVNRKGKGKSIRARQEGALVERGYSATIAGDAKVVLVEGDPSSSNLGVDEQLYAEIRDSITSIIHIAWRVDFNLSLSSFEPLIKGLRNLVDLSLTSPRSVPPRLVFASSVSIFENWHSSSPAEEKTTYEPEIAVGTGYGESKWVVEKILDNAAKATPLRPVIVRIGQLSGGINGSWNTAEWIPAIVRSGEVVGALPTSDKPISWLPLHVAAAAMIDFQSSPYQAVHLAHPTPVSWSSVFEPIAKTLNVPLVPYADWLARLESAIVSGGSEAGKTNPALYLIDMFRGYSEDVTKDVEPEARDALGPVQLGTELAVSVSKALQDVKSVPLGTEDALKWVAFWRRAAFLKTRAPLGA